MLSLPLKGLGDVIAKQIKNVATKNRFLLNKILQTKFNASS